LKPDKSKRIVRSNRDPAFIVRLNGPAARGQALREAQCVFAPIATLPEVAAGARPQCRFVLPLIRFVPGSLNSSVPLL
jgi:hypothetical protein